MNIRRAITDVSPWYVIAVLLIVAIAASVTWRTYYPSTPNTPVESQQRQ